MERLTYWCEDGRGVGKWFVAIDSEGGEDYGPHIDRLAAYEKTGLEPEEIAKIREDVENGYLKSTARRYGIPVDRLRELAKADREGRVVVLPTFCDGCAHHSEHDGKHWCKFWHRYCPDDSDFYCKAAKKLLEGDAGDEQA